MTNGYHEIPQGQQAEKTRAEDKARNRQQAGQVEPTTSTAKEGPIATVAGAGEKRSAADDGQLSGSN